MKNSLLFFLAAIFAFPAILSADSIRVTNYADGETISYPVALIYGTLENPDAAEIVCENISSRKASRVIPGDAFRGRFKVLAELVPGENHLVLKSGEAEFRLMLQYAKNENPTYVRIIYMTDSGGGTEFQTPVENDPQDFRGKLDTAMKIMQTFTAERMHDLGFGRKTFNLELDENGDVRVHVFRGKRPAEEYYALDDGAWYDAVYNEIKEEFPMDAARNLVIPAYTRFDPATKKDLAHTALGGGGGLALFGSGNLFTWPDSLAEVVPAFRNTTPIDGNQVKDDSVGRSNFWGAASTTIGAALHELGHTFFLPHTNHEQDIMTRGFDRFNRVFLVREAPHAYNPEFIDFPEDEIAMFAPISAYPLACGPWFAQDDPEKRPKTEVKMEMNHETGIITLTAESGLYYIGCFVHDERKWFWGLPFGEEAPGTFSFQFHDMKNVAENGRRYEFMACDVYGNATYMAVLVNGGE